MKTDAIFYSFIDQHVEQVETYLGFIKNKAVMQKLFNEAVLAN